MNGVCSPELLHIVCIFFFFFFLSTETRRSTNIHSPARFEPFKLLKGLSGFPIETKLETDDSNGVQGWEHTERSRNSEKSKWSLSRGVQHVRDKEPERERHVLYHGFYSPKGNPRTSRLLELAIKKRRNE